MESHECVRAVIEGSSNLEEILATLEEDMSSTMKEEFKNEEQVIEIKEFEESTSEVCHSTQIDQNQSAEADSPTGNVPSVKVFPGMCNFKMSLNTSAKASWVYSSVLDQVFIDMKKVLMVQFEVDCMMPGLFIRALPVYSSMDYISHPVLRCTVHAIEDDPGGQAHSQDGECLCLNYNLSGHVLRVFSLDADYCFDSRSHRHSVRVPLANPQPGTNCLQVPYVFACKTSCSRGMQRRHVNIVFTLETPNCHVIGRQVLSVKICSCPKRDKDRMEKTHLDLETVPVPRSNDDNDGENPPAKRMRLVQLKLKEIKEKMSDWLKTCEELRTLLSSTSTDKFI